MEDKVLIKEELPITKTISNQKLLHYFKFPNGLDRLKDGIVIHLPLHDCENELAKSIQTKRIMSDERLAAFVNQWLCKNRAPIQKPDLQLIVDQSCLTLEKRLSILSQDVKLKRRLKYLQKRKFKEANIQNLQLKMIRSGAFKPKNLSHIFDQPV